MLHLFPLALIAGYVIHVLVLQVGSPLLGGPRLDWKRTALTCLAAPVAVLLASLLLGLPLGCLSSWFGVWLPVGTSLAIAIGARSLLVSFLLGITLGRAAILSAIGAVLGWAAMGAAWVGNFGWALTV